MAPCCGCGPRRAIVTTGCGLTGNGSAATPLAAATADWPYPCDIDAAAGGVYCDPATGQLRGEPSPVTDYISDGTFASFPAPGQPVPTNEDSSQIVATYSHDITNPSSCKEAFVVLEKGIDMDLRLPAGARGMYGMVQDFAGGSADEFYKITNTGSTTAVSDHAQLTAMGRLTIPPGGTVTETVELIAGWGTNGATYTRYQINFRAWIFVL